jgi:hypothetical protein
MTSKRGTPFRVTVERDLLRLYPQLAKLPAEIDPQTLDAFASAIEARPEGMSAQIANGTVRIESRSPIQRGRLDYLGLEIPDPELKEICEIIREDTGIDPRRYAIYCERGSIFNNLPESARVHTRNGLPALHPKAQRHPLDPISSEEIQERRLLAETRWSRSKQRQPQVNDRDRAETEKRINEVKQYFDRRSKAKR